MSSGFAQTPCHSHSPPLGARANQLHSICLDKPSHQPDSRDEGNFERDEIVNSAILSEAVYADLLEISEELQGHFVKSRIGTYCVSPEFNLTKREIVKAILSLWFRKHGKSNDLRFTDAQGLAVTLNAGKTRKTFFAFRGTERKLADFVTNLHSNLEHVEGMGKVHQGFLYSFRRLFELIKGDLENVSSDGEVIFSGHSLGGAIAILMGANYNLLYPSRKPARVYTFGAPGIGDTNAATSISSLLGGSILSFVIDKDPVPKLPASLISIGGPFPEYAPSPFPGLVFDANRVAEPRLVCQASDHSNGKFYSQSDWSNHWMEQYLFRLVKSAASLQGVLNSETESDCKHFRPVYLGKGNSSNKPASSTAMIPIKGENWSTPFIGGSEKGDVCTNLAELIANDFSSDTGDLDESMIETVLCKRIDALGSDDSRHLVSFQDESLLVEDSDHFLDEMVGLIASAIPDYIDPSDATHYSVILAEKIFETVVLNEPRSSQHAFLGKDSAPSKEVSRRTKWLIDRLFRSYKCK